MLKKFLVLLTITILGLTFLILSVYYGDRWFWWIFAALSFVDLIVLIILASWLLDDL